MASKCRRKQCQPRRIVRQNRSGSKATISYLVVNNGEDLDDEYNSSPNSPLKCEIEQISRQVEQHHEILQEISSPLVSPETDSNANVMISQEPAVANPLIQLPLSFESFQNAALINFAINQEILRKASLPHFAFQHGTLHCNFCGQVFSQQTTLDVHMRVYHSGIEFTQNGAAEEESSAKEGKFNCNQCRKSFNHLWNLTQHMKAHDPQTKTFPCQYCDKVFSHDCNRRIHLRSHTGEKPFRCEMCGRRFSHKHNMRVHMRTHTREKPYQCPHCTKAFAHVSALKIHSRVHSGEKPYSCEDCGKEFSHSSTLNVHRRRHTGEKPFQCETCDKTFSRDYILKNHLKTHTENDDNHDISELDS